jgi:hypothetical protein
MANEGFLRRWSRLKLEAGAGDPRPEPAAVPAATAPGPDGALPTLADAMRLDAQSDYSAFVGRGVDASVRRLAMKKLFSDPHFKILDGLDIHMEDYNRPDPISPAMLAALQHVQKLFAPLAGPDEPPAAPSIDAAQLAAEPPAATPPRQDQA